MRKRFVTLAGLTLLPLAFVAVASAGPASATTKHPTVARAAQCEKAAEAHKKVTKTEAVDCMGLPLIKQSCSTGPSAIVIKIGPTNIAIRQGQKPLRLGRTYTITQLLAICEQASATVTSPSAVAAAPTPPRPAPIVTTTTRGPVATTTTPPPPTTATPPAACHPMSAAGNCYSAGEFCSDADHGLSGVAGNEETIVCEDENGWRWVAS